VRQDWPVTFQRRALAKLMSYKKEEKRLGKKGYGSREGMRPIRRGLANDGSTSTDPRAR
jgi:hypothetical protein